MSFQLILPFFPDELRTLLMDPSISDLMINGASGVYAAGRTYNVPSVFLFVRARAMLILCDCGTLSPKFGTLLP